MGIVMGYSEWMTSKEAERGALALLESYQGDLAAFFSWVLVERMIPELVSRQRTQQQHGHFDEMQRTNTLHHEVSPKLEQMFLTGCRISIPGAVQSSLAWAGPQQAAVASQVSHSVSADSRAVQMQRDHQRGCAPGLCGDLQQGDSQRCLWSVDHHL